VYPEKQGRQEEGLPPDYMKTGIIVMLLSEVDEN
jgi:hypothetical protein